MPNHDYRCPTCHFVLRDQYRSIEQGGRATAPICPQCGFQQRMIWVVPRLRTDLRSDGDSATFKKFLARDGRNQLVEIDSLHKLRQVERESEQLARNGEGQHITFRGFAQDHSNLLLNTHGEPPAFEKPSEEAKRKWGLRGNTKAIETASDGSEIPYGPGVTDDNTSALKDVT
jgi:hypothetical protein